MGGKTFGRFLVLSCKNIFNHNFFQIAKGLYGIYYHLVTSKNITIFRAKLF